jgi:hypothetical protein
VALVRVTFVGVAFVRVFGCFGSFRRCCGRDFGGVC